MRYGKQHFALGRVNNLRVAPLIRIEPLPRLQIDLVAIFKFVDVPENLPMGLPVAGNGKVSQFAGGLGFRVMADSDRVQDIWTNSVGYGVRKFLAEAWDIEDAEGFPVRDLGDGGRAEVFSAFVTDIELLGKLRGDLTLGTVCVDVRPPQLPGNKKKRHDSQSDENFTDSTEQTLPHGHFGPEPDLRSCHGGGSLVLSRSNREPGNLQLERIVLAMGGTGFAFHTASLAYRSDNPLAGSVRRLKTEGDAVPVSKTRRKNHNPQDGGEARTYDKPLPKWYKPVMFGLMLLGLVWIMVYYISQTLFPIPMIGGWNIVIGFGIAMVGFFMTTGWR